MIAIRVMLALGLLTAGSGVVKAPRFESIRDALSGLAGAADDENGVVGCVVHAPNSTDRR
jgi:hypothetical protein